MVPERSNAGRRMRTGECTKSKIWNRANGRLALVAAICAVFATPQEAAAASSNSLTLLSTKISSMADDLVLSTTPAAGFDQITLACPPGELCTIRIEFSAQFFKLSPQGVSAQVSINGVTTGVWPRSRIDLVSGVEGYATETFTVWRKGLAPGQYTVSVGYRLNSTVPPGSEQGGAGVRTLTVQMFAQ